jgi:hypothetical protein
MTASKLHQQRREIGEAPRCFEVFHMYDQWVERRPSLGIVNSCNRSGNGGVSGEPVNGLGGDSDGLGGEHQSCGLGNRLLAVRE